MFHTGYCHCYWNSFRCSWDLARRTISYISQSLSVLMTVLLSHLSSKRAELVKPMKAFHAVFYHCDTACITWRLPYLPWIGSSKLALWTHGVCGVTEWRFPWSCRKQSLEAQPRTDLSAKPVLGPEPERCSEWEGGCLELGVWGLGEGEGKRDLF